MPTGTAQNPKAAYLSYLRNEVADLRAEIAGTLHEIEEKEALIKAVEAGSVSAASVHTNGTKPDSAPIHDSRKLAAIGRGSWITFANIKRGEGKTPEQIKALWLIEKARLQQEGK